MEDVILTIPGDSLADAKLPPREIQRELQLRLALALYSDGILSGAAACRMAGVGKVEFQYLAGGRGITQPITPAGMVEDEVNLQRWNAAG